MYKSAKSLFIGLAVVSALGGAAISHAQSILPGEHDWQSGVFAPFPDYLSQSEFPVGQPSPYEIPSENYAFCMALFDYSQTQTAQPGSADLYQTYCEPLSICDPHQHEWPYEDCIEFSFYGAEFN